MHFDFAQYKQHGFVPVLIIIIIAIVAGIGGYYVFTTNYSNLSRVISRDKTPEDQIACTQDAKLCPDGTSVGRVGPNCDFSPCPTPSPFLLRIEDGRYINKTYNFSTSIPTGMGVVSTGDYVADFFDQVDIDKLDNSPYKRKLRISVNQSERDFGKIYSAKVGSIIPEEQHSIDAVFTKIKNYTVDGYKAIEYTYDVPGNQTEKTFTNGTIVNKDGDLIEISTFTAPTIYNRILSTFRFLP